MGKGQKTAKKQEKRCYSWHSSRTEQTLNSSSLSLTADCEGATRQHLPLVVLQGVVALVRLRHPLGHPHLATPLQSTATHVAGLSVRPVPQHNRHGLRGGAAGGKFQQGAIFRDMVRKVFTVVSVVGLDAF